MIRNPRIQLGIALTAELLCLLALLLLGDLRRHFPGFLLCFALASAAFLFAARPSLLNALTLRGTLLFAVLLRVPMLFATPSLSDDVWRYLHDGRAQRAGVSPYEFPPNNPRTHVFAGPETPRINNPGLPTIYPPGAQLVFAAAAFVHPGLAAWKLILLGFDLAIILLLGRILRALGRPPTGAALYAWHPLVIIEVAGSAHLDPIAIAPFLLALLLLGRGRAFSAGVAAGYSVAARLISAAYLPFLLDRNLRRTGLGLLVTIGALYAAYAMGSTASVLGSLGTFAETWRSNPSAFAWLARVLPDRTARMTAAALVLVLATVLAQRGIDRHYGILLTTLALLLLSPVVHPWYVLWLVPFCALADRSHVMARAAWVWTFSVVLAYAVLPAFVATGEWRVPEWALWAEYVPVYGVLAALAVRTASPRFARSAAAP